MKQMRNVIFALSFAIFLALGMQLGQQWSRAANPGPTEYPVVSGSLYERTSSLSQSQNPGITIIIPTPVIATEQQQQHSSMVITVDDSAGSAPRLVSIWYVVIYPNDDSITLMPVFPSINTKHQQRDQQLAVNFRLTEEGLLDPLFLSEIYNLGILWHGEYVLVHENAITEIAAFFAKSDQQFEITNVQALTTWEKDALAAVQSQAALLQELCSATSLDLGADNIVNFISALSPHLQTNIPPERITADWRYLAAYGNQLDCEFPTLTP